MAPSDIKPFSIAIPDDELQLVGKKLRLARLPTGLANSQWGESNGVTLQMMQDTVKFWKDKYDWRAEEAKINQMPQFRTAIELDGFGSLDIHFVHASSKEAKAVPLLFIHGWPGSFLEVQKILGRLTAAGYHVVAPSLPGYGFSSYTDKEGFRLHHHAETLHRLMLKLGYDKYVVQGGDWGSAITQTLAAIHPEHVQAIHVNMLFPGNLRLDPKYEYTEAEKAAVARTHWFEQHQSAYQKVQTTKPRTLGFAMHDSPVGMLAWMADKLHVWTDAYAWTPAELITWTLLHYFPGPTTAFQTYRANMPGGEMDEEQQRRQQQQPGYSNVPTGVSHFPKELAMAPRSWADSAMNIKFWRVHDKGGHFAAWERPEELAGDMIEFFDANVKNAGA